jgi:chemotaxis protein methyltransferase CheR
MAALGSFSIWMACSAVRQMPDLEVEGAATLTPQTFDRIRRLVYDKAGIDLKKGKEQLVSARLARKLRETGTASYEDYMRRVETDRTGESLVAMIDALTTNYTSFMRETAHFDFLKQVILPKLAGRNSVDIWCAAAATGEEPYSLMFTMLDALSGIGAPPCRLLATDISTRALDAARKGIYPAERFDACRREWLPKYLLRGDGDFTGLYQVKPEVARRIEFRRLNLVENFDPGRKFPLISCRNVMIYFDQPTQERVVNRLVSFLEPGGYLFVGHSERLAGINHTLRLLKPAIYQNGSPAQPMRG